MSLSNRDKSESLLGASKLVLLEGNSQQYGNPQAYQRSYGNYPPKRTYQPPQRQTRQYAPPPPPVPLYQDPTEDRMPYQENYVPLAPVKTTKPVMSNTVPRSNIIQYAPPKPKPKKVWDKPQTAYKEFDNTFKQGMHINNPAMQNLMQRTVEYGDRFMNDEDFREQQIRLSEAQALAEELALQEEELQGDGTELFSLCGKIPIAYTNPEKVKYIRPHLKKIFVTDSGMLSGEEFDSLKGEELLGFLSFIGKAIKGIGKGIGSVAKTVGKGIGAVGKFAVKNLPGIVSTAASFLPGGGVISAGIDTVTGLLSPGSNNQQQQQQLAPATREEVYQPQELYYPPEQYYQPPQNYYSEEQYYQPPPPPPPPNYYGRVQQQNYYQDPYYPPQQNYYDPYNSGMLRGNIFEDIVKGIKKAGEWIIDPVNQRKISVLSSGAANLQTQGKYYIDNAGDIARWQQASEEAKFNVTQGSEDILKTWALPIGIGLIGILLLTSSRR